MKPIKYQIGDIINEKIIQDYKYPRYTVECQRCGKIIKQNVFRLETKKCSCWKKIGRRFSGRVYKNSPEKIEAIKEKYKNGVTAEILNEFLNSI